MTEAPPRDTVRLGRSSLVVSALGVGTWAWGDTRWWGFGSGYTENDVADAFGTSIEEGINFFDTAEIYASGRSERFLGEFAANGSHAVVATKFFPFPWRLRKRSVIEALRRSLERLRMDQVDLYQIHWPLPPVPIENWVDGLADATEAGLVRAVGVSNFSTDQMRRAHAALASRGIPLASNQVQYSLLSRKPEKTGLLEACRELNVTLIAYSPLAQGLLTGKYSPDSPPPGLRGRRVKQEYLSQIQPLVESLRHIGAAHGEKTPGQVALNWTICRGALPIPGAKDGRQARENAGALGWRLSPDETTALDELSAERSNR